MLLLGLALLVQVVRRTTHRSAAFCRSASSWLQGEQAPDSRGGTGVLRWADNLKKQVRG
jgi:hypothetical protein